MSISTLKSNLRDQRVSKCMHRGCIWSHNMDRERWVRRLGLHWVKTGPACLEVNQSTLLCIGTQPLISACSVKGTQSEESRSLSPTARCGLKSSSSSSIRSSSSGLKSKVDLNATRQVPALHVCATQAINWQIQTRSPHFKAHLHCSWDSLSERDAIRLKLTRFMHGEKKREREQKANPSNTQASGSSGTSILWRTAVSGASAATGEAQSCSPPSPCQSQQRRDAHSHERWSVAGSLGGRLLLALELLHREPKLPSSLSYMSRAVRAAQLILCRLQSSTSALHGWHMWAWGSRRYSSPFIRYVPALNRRVVIPGPCASSAVTAINGPADQAAEMYLSLLLN